MAGTLYLVSLGPGDPGLLVPRARQALEESEVVVGYRFYMDWVRKWLPHKDCRPFEMSQEVERAREAVRLASEGHKVSLVSGGDVGIYGMAGLAFEVLRQQGWDGRKPYIEVIPGVTAASAAAALLGAPLMNDFAVISLSDLLTPLEVILRRLEAAARADLVIVLYNPASRERKAPLEKACEVLSCHRSPMTPVGLVRNAYREGQRVELITLGSLLEHNIDMMTTVVVGNSTTFCVGHRLVTPRGYSS